MTEVKRIKRRHRRAAKQTMEQEARARSWEDREEQRRPTPERLRHGAWRLVDGEDAGVSVAVDGISHPLSWLEVRGCIDADQSAAAQQWMELHEAAGFLRKGKDCLTLNEPRGYDATEGNPTASADYRELSGRLSFRQSAALRAVMVESVMPGPKDVMAFIEACGVCQTFFARRR
jgi:hypothetical protein